MSELTPTAQFEALLAPILDRAFALAYRLTNDRDDAQDLIQDAAVRAFTAFGSFEAGTNFKAWLFRIVVTTHLNRARNASRRPQTVPLDEGEDLFLFEQTKREGLKARGVDPAAALLQKLDAELVMEALMMLPDEFRVVATLYFVDMLSYDDIAQMVGCPVGTVRSRLHRARKMLQKSLWELARERGIVRGEN